MLSSKDKREIYVTLVLFGAVLCATENQKFYVREDEGARLLGAVRLDFSDSSTPSPKQLREMKYKFMNQDDPVVRLFSLNAQTGDLSTVTALDHEGPACKHQKVCNLSLDVAAHSGRFVHIFTVSVIVEDVNDQPPTFQLSKIKLDIPESSDIGTTFPLATATDSDGYGNNSKIRYALQNNDRNLFILKLTKNILLGRDELVLVVNGTLDRELIDKHLLRIIAKDSGIPQLTGTLDISVTVTDINDNRPNFSKNVYNVTIPENIDINSTILQVVATDEDIGINKKLQYSILSLGSPFVIDDSGVIRVSGVVDYETKTTYRLVVAVRDMGQQPLTSQALVLVNIEDENDNAPDIKFSFLSRDMASISETAQNGDFVAQASITDPDSGLSGQVECSITDRRFILTKTKENRYQITLNSSVDRETTPIIKVDLNCHDFGSPRKISNKTLDINIEDVNDNRPKFSKVTYFPIITENNRVGDAILTVAATDPDAGRNADVNYYLTSDTNKNFFIEPKTGVLKARIVLDREVLAQWRFLVWARDNGETPKSASASVILTLLDVNDHSPTFTSPPPLFIVPENDVRGFYVGTVTANDPDIRENGKISYSLVNNEDSRYFRISSNDGAITTKVSFDRERKDSYTIIVVSKDGGLPALSNTLSIPVFISDVNDNEPIVDFPSERNNSVTVDVPKGKVDTMSLTRVLAYDNDNGENSTLSYNVKKSNCSACFSIDADSGEIILLGKPAGYPAPWSVSYLVIGVSDRGVNPKDIEVKLFVKIRVRNRTHTSPKSHSEDGSESTRNDNISIVIGVITATLLLSIIIVIVILLIRRKDKNARQAEQRVLNASTASNHAPDVERASSKHASNENVDRILIKDISNRNSARNSIRSHQQPPISLVMPPAGYDLNTNTSFQASWMHEPRWSPLTVNDTAQTYAPLPSAKPPPYPSRAHREGNRPQVSTVQKSVRWHGDELDGSPVWRAASEYSFPLKRDHQHHLDDTHSDHSGDSGRGGSEEDTGSKILPHYV